MNEFAVFNDWSKASESLFLSIGFVETVAVSISCTWEEGNSSTCVGRDVFFGAGKGAVHALLRFVVMPSWVRSRRVEVEGFIFLLHSPCLDNVSMVVVLSTLSTLRGAEGVRMLLRGASSLDDAAVEREPSWHPLSLSAVARSVMLWCRPTVGVEVGWSVDSVVSPLDFVKSFRTLLLSVLPFKGVVLDFAVDLVLSVARTGGVDWFLPSRREVEEST